MPDRAANARSPFVRLRELLGDTPPGKSAISLAVGEPQHPIPPFVAPVIAAHVAEFGRYPVNKGLDEFAEAVAQWLGRRYDSAAPGRSGDRSAGAQRHPRGTVSRRARRQELGDAARRPAGGADSQSVLCRLCGRRDRRRLRAGLSADDRGDRLSARPRCARRRVAGAHRRLLSRLAVESAGRGRRSRLSRKAHRAGAAFRLPRSFADECYCEIYSEHPPPGMLASRRARFRQCRGVPLAVEAFEFAGPAHRLCRRRP